MTHEIRTGQGYPYVVFIPTEEGEMNLRLLGDPQRPEMYEGEKWSP